MSDRISSDLVPTIIETGTPLHAQQTPRDLRPLARNVLVTLLAVNSGYIDAVGFLALGGAFTSVMTGNMVLLGLSAGTVDGTLASHAGLAIISFVIGCWLGTLVARTPQADDPIWPRPISRALCVELLLVLGFAVTWRLLSNHPSPDWQLVLLALNAAALGVQSSAVQRFGVAGLSTTYLTGTLTHLVIRLASGQHARRVGHSGSLLIALIAGASLGGLFATHARWLVPVTPMVLLLAVLLGAYFSTRQAPTA